MCVNNSIDRSLSFGLDGPFCDNLFLMVLAVYKSCLFVFRSLEILKRYTNLLANNNKRKYYQLSVMRYLTLQQISQGILCCG